LHFSRQALWAVVATVVLLLAGGGFLTSQYLFHPTDVASLKKEYRQKLASLKEERTSLRRDMEQFQEAREGMQAALRSLGRQVGTMQARMNRLDSLGKRVVQVAGLSDGEFNFNRDPAVGGPDEASVTVMTGGQNLTELARQVKRLSARLADREDQLELLQGMVDRRAVRERMRPNGWPSTGGAWLSSDFGRRIDPFTGKPAYHYGVDIANHEGEPVKALAPGVVTWAGDRYGYGQLVEIDHGNGYRTRYGHNKEVKVEVGERVTKNTVVGAVGNTGRSTGPHIHLEVLHNGEKIDPRKFLDR
jgi:murein DD-endopeptidase MepM/ murein hydrolase activator NlpD